MKDLMKALLAGERLVGPLVTCPTPSVVELVGNAGFDWVLIDTEQSCTSPAGPDLANMVRAANAAGVTPTVRVSDNSESQINNALNLGAKAVWVPHIETPEQAAQAVASFHYAPKGQRGAAPIVRAADYGLMPFDEYRQQQIEETFLILIIESKAGLERIKEIASVSGVDAICFGPFDMAVDLGLNVEDFYGSDLKRWIHPSLEKAGTQILETCQVNGIIPVTAAWNLETGQEWVRRGYRMLLYGLDMAIFAKALQTLRGQSDVIKNTK